MPNLYLMRHAHAEGVGGEITRDYDRPLSARGLQQVEAVARRIGQNGLSIRSIISSPLPRAWETAKLLAKRLPPCDLQNSLILSPRGSAPDISPWLPSLSTKGALLLIGHQPDLSLLSIALSRYDPGFGVGCLAAYKWDALGRRADFLWSLSPDDLPA